MTDSSDASSGSLIGSKVGKVGSEVGKEGEGVDETFPSLPWRMALNSDSGSNLAGDEEVEEGKGLDETNGVAGGEGVGKALPPLALRMELRSDSPSVIRDATGPGSRSAGTLVSKAWRIEVTYDSTEAIDAEGSTLGIKPSASLTNVPSSCSTSDADRRLAICVEGDAAGLASTIPTATARTVMKKTECILLTETDKRQTSALEANNTRAGVGTKLALYSPEYEGWRIGDRMVVKKLLRRLVEKEERIRRDDIT